MQPFHLFNSLSGKKEEFKPYNPPNVGMYTCGFTVYDHTHIGHVKKYVGDDVLHRTLEFLGYKVKHVQNVTDVGHLVSDADEGEDKLEKGAKKHGLSVVEVARKFENEFYEAMDIVNNLRPTVVQRAADDASIAQQIEFIKKLIDNDFAYIADSAVYFNIKKLSEYNPFSNQLLEDKVAGNRKDLVTDEQKKSPADFVLWVFTKGIHENHVMKWESPWGTGFPGWHIECSAIGICNLGEHIDIHTGGIDHKEIHHPNEIAQNFGVTGHEVVKYWVHHNFLTVDGKKMSKSRGTMFTLQDVINKGFSPMALRYLMLQAHYRSQLNFTWEGLQGAQNAYGKLVSAIGSLRGSSTSKAIPDSEIVTSDKPPRNDGVGYLHQFTESLSDDLNTSKALAVMWEVVGNSFIENSEKLKLLLKFDEVFGLQLTQVKGAKIEIPKEVLELKKHYEKARKNKDYEQSDKLRDRAKELGYEFQTTAEATQILPV